MKQLGILSRSNFESVFSYCNYSLGSSYYFSELQRSCYVYQIIENCGRDKSIIEVIDAALPIVEEHSIIAVTSKIVSICEGNIVSKDAVSKEELIAQESDLYVPATLSKYGHHFTITNKTLIQAGQSYRRGIRAAYYFFGRGLFRAIFDGCGLESRIEQGRAVMTNRLES